MTYIEKIFKNQNSYLLLLFLFIGLLLGLLVSNYYFGKYYTELGSDSEFHAGGYKFINPLYECVSEENFKVREFRNLENDLIDFINESKAEGVISHASIYFRDLNNGPWFGINEKDNFSPSSLLKLPVMIAYYREAEENPSLLLTKIKYDSVPQGLLPQNFETEIPLQIGKEYTVKELIERMIVGSDNAAYLVLVNNIDESDIDKVTLDLGIPTVTEDTPNDFMNVKDYATLFRVLFNASYINKKYSEEALALLSKSEFNQGLTASLPKNALVAHKFGERDFVNGTKQLHDCGIVYYPKHPYLICVMTRGANFNNLSLNIQDISDMVFKEVQNRYPLAYFSHKKTLN